MPEDQESRRVDLLVAHTREMMEARFAAIEQGISVAKDQMNYRLAMMNNLREQTNRLESSMLTKEAFDRFEEAINRDIRELREARAELAGKATQASFQFTAIVALMGVALGIASLVTRLLN